MSYIGQDTNQPVIFRLRAAIDSSRTNLLSLSKIHCCMKPSIAIEYCPKCNWLLRAAWMAQELLSTFSEDVQGVTLIPSETAGRYTVHVNDILIWDRKREGHFPEPKELKQKVRDIIAPDRSLGHNDR
jgi:selenoprotein W-related protein